MPSYIKSIEAKGVLGRFDIYQEFQEGVNVIFGRNGTGKTTLLHILANLLNGDYKRFAFIEFNTIKVKLDDDTNISVLQQKSEEDTNIIVSKNSDLIANLSVKSVMEIYEQEKVQEERRLVGTLSYVEKIRRYRRNNKDITPILPSAYFPAFRTMIEAWASANSINYNQRKSKEIQVITTNFARELFGDFVPELNYPSPIDIEYELGDEIRNALFRIARADREYLGDMVPSIFQVLSDNPELPDYSSSFEDTEAILEEIYSLVSKLDDYPLKAAPTITKLRNSVSLFQKDERLKIVAQRVLNIYRKALQEVVAVQETSFKSIETYLNSVNSFLEGKKIQISSPESRLSSKPSLKIEFETGKPKTIRAIRRALSSGERQIVTMIYAATHMSKQQVVLIDEPEISLHVDWQRHLLKKMSEQLGDRQIIVCTHSPVIGADYEEQVIIFEPKITHSSETTNDSGVVEEDSEGFDG